jgi:hypothetical protein
MLTERDLAARLFEQMTGKPAPAVTDDYPKWKQWDITVNEQDGSQPLYRSDRSRRALNLYLHEGQRRVWDSDRRFVFMIAGKQSGKTIYGPLWLFTQILARGAGDYLAVSATYDLFKLKMLPAIKEFFIQELQIGKWWAGDRILEIRNPYTGEFEAERADDPMWARIILRSADSEEGLQSATAKAAWLDEPGLYKATVWKDVLGRLSLHRGQVLGTTTPYDLGWLKQIIYDPWVKGLDTDIDVIQFSSKLSPFFSDEEYEMLRTKMQSWQFRMDYDAEFGRPPAAIYEDFLDKLRGEGGHKVPRKDIQLLPHHPRFVAIDPGTVNPAKIWIAHITEEDIYVVYRAEKGGKRLTSKEHARKDVREAKERGERVIWWAIGAKSEKYWREDYKTAGASSVKEPDVADVEKGIDRVTHLWKTFRLYVMDDLYDLIDEILKYSREVDPVSGDVLPTIKDKSKFHLLDTVRYFAVQVVSKKKTWRVDTSVDNWA